MEYLLTSVIIAFSLSIFLVWQYRKNRIGFTEVLIALVAVTLFLILGANLDFFSPLQSLLGFKTISNMMFVFLFVFILLMLIRLEIRIRESERIQKIIIREQMLGKVIDDEFRC